ncbi:MAG: DUF3298 domain-containing protein [Mycobacterium sp.]|nr:DUF3298 domain-containing protein [Mycobacterium sp.]
MRMLKVIVLAAALVALGSPAQAAAAPKNYCADLKGDQVGSACQIKVSDPGYEISISFPSDYPDQKSIAEYISQTRDQFLNVAKSSTPRDLPYELDITANKYSSAIPPRGTTSVVLTVYQSTGAAHPVTSFKAFNWDQAYRKAITYDTLWQADTDPLKVVFPIVQADLQKQAAETVPIAPSVGLDPTYYQQFAVTNDGVIFFFGQGQLLPEVAGPVQVLVPRSAIDPMLA